MSSSLLTRDSVLLDLPDDGFGEVLFLGVGFTFYSFLDPALLGFGIFLDCDCL